MIMYRNFRFGLILFIIALCCFGFTGLSANKGYQSNHTADSLSYAAKSKVVYDLILDKLYEPKSGLFLENYPPKPDDRKVWYLWSNVSVVSGVNALMKIGYDQKELLPVVDRFSKY
jgi:hypothetical protein